jgi:hypothetical protein
MTEENLAERSVKSMPEFSPGENFEEIPKELYGTFVTQQLLETVFLVDPGKILPDRMTRLRLAIRQRFHEMWKFWKLQHRGTVPLKKFVEKKYWQALVSGVALCFLNTERYYEILDRAEFSTFLEFVVLEETTTLDPDFYQEAKSYPVNARYANVLEKHPHLEGRARIASFIDAMPDSRHATPEKGTTDETKEEVETQELPQILDPRASLESEYASPAVYEPVVVPMEDQPEEPNFPVIREDDPGVANALNEIRTSLISDISAIIRKDGKISLGKFWPLVCAHYLEAQSVLGSLVAVEFAACLTFPAMSGQHRSLLLEKDFYFSLWRNYFVPACPQTADNEPD